MERVQDHMPSVGGQVLALHEYIFIYLLKKELYNVFSKQEEGDGLFEVDDGDYNVETINDGLNEFNVKFHGPKESLYEGRVWKIRVELPDAYPYKSPSIGFVHKILHPNVDEHHGVQCLLLLYPNPSDPLSGDAESLMMKDRQKYDQKVKEYCEQYAKRENITKSTVEERSDEDEDEDITEEESGSGSSDDDIAGHVDA